MEEYGTQLDLFDLMYDYHKFDKGRPVRLIETFAGIGTQKMAFDRLGIDVDVIAIVEVDKFAMLSYASIHTDYLELRPTYFDTHEHTHQEMVDYLQERNIGINFTNMKQSITIRNNIEIVRDYYLACILTKNLGDISKVKGRDLPKGIDVLTYSFPCTDLSKAGQQKGLSDTRSGLVYQVFRIVDELKELNNKPTILIMENVVDLIQSKFINEFNEMQLELEDKEYINYNFVMNAKDFGVAQNRNRVFMVSLPLESNYKEPEPFKLEKRLKDYLEDEVDEKYYLSDTFIKGMSTNSSDNYDRASIFESSVKSADEWGYSTAITTREGNVATSTFIKITEATKQGYAEAYDGDGVYINRPHQKRGVVQKGMIQTLKTSGTDVGVVVEVKGNEKYVKERLEDFEDKNGFYPKMFNPYNIAEVNELAPTITTMCDRWQSSATVAIKSNLRIRKLTPLECWRLMGIDDECFYKAQQVTSNSQLYKQAGNAIVVDVFAKILESFI